MLPCFVTRHAKHVVPIKIVLQNDFSQWLNKQTQIVKQWLAARDFRGEAGNFSLIPDASGKLHSVICCVTDLRQFWGVGGLPFALPEGVYSLDLNAVDYQRCAI